MSDLVMIDNGSTRLAQNAFTWDEHVFLSWNTRADGRGTSISDGAGAEDLPGDSSSVTLYAQWEEETGMIIETKWNRNADIDDDGNGTADVMELKPSDTAVKDPSVKNHTDKSCYAYILASVPTVNAVLAKGSGTAVYDAAVLDITSHWKLISSSVSSNTGSKSKYVYRYDTALSAYGTADKNPYQSARRADRTTDLMTGFTVRGFTDIDDFSGSIDINAVLIESAVAESEADTLALEAFRSNGYL